VTPAADNGFGDHGRFEEDLPAYALDALEPPARVALEAHLEGCERCREQVAWLRPAAAALAVSVPQLASPPRLRRRVLAVARAEAKTAAPGAPPVRHRPAWLMPAAAGAAAVAVSLAIAIVDIGGGSGTDSTTVAVDVAADGAATAEGSLVIEGGAATLEVDGMPALRGGDVYQAWLQREGEIEPSSTFIVDRQGDGAVTIPRTDDADRLMVTREPRGGSEVPSTAPLIAAELDPS
jgi:anti-sigma factor RsiW